MSVLSLWEIMEKIIMLGTSDTWSMSCSSQRTNDPAYYFEDCRISSMYIRHLAANSHQIQTLDALEPSWYLNLRSDVLNYYDLLTKFPMTYHTKLITFLNFYCNILFIKILTDPLHKLITFLNWYCSTYNLYKIFTEPL